MKNFLVKFCFADKYNRKYLYKLILFCVNIQSKTNLPMKAKTNEKIKLLLCTALVAIFLIQVQADRVKVVSNFTPGHLSSGLTYLERKITTKLIIKGSINRQDLMFLSDMNALTDLDLKHAILPQNDVKDFVALMRLKSIVLPDSAKRVCSISFLLCYNLSTITIPACTYEIAPSAFSSVFLTKVVDLSMVPQVISPDAFGDLSKCKLVVPDAAVEAYKNANVWKNFKSITGISSERN